MSLVSRVASAVFDHLSQGLSREASYLYLSASAETMKALEGVDLSIYGDSQEERAETLIARMVLPIELAVAGGILGANFSRAYYVSIIGEHAGRILHEVSILHLTNLRDNLKSLDHKKVARAVLSDANLHLVR